MCIFYLIQVIVTEAAKIMQDVGGSWKLSALIGEDESMSQMGSLTERPVALRSPSKNWKVSIIIEVTSILL